MSTDTGIDMAEVRRLIAEVPEDEIDAVLTVLALTGGLPEGAADLSAQDALALAVEKDPQAVAEAAVFVMLFS